MAGNQRALRPDGVRSGAWAPGLHKPERGRTQNRISTTSDPARSAVGIVKSPETAADLCAITKEARKTPEPLCWKQTQYATTTIRNYTLRNLTLKSLARYQPVLRQAAFWKTFDMLSLIGSDVSVATFCASDASSLVCADIASNCLRA